MLVLVTGCHRKNDDGTPVGAGGAMPGMGVTTMKTYGGVIAARAPGFVGNVRQTVTVNADVIDFPSDQVVVRLCKNADCSQGSIPAVLCSTVWNQPAIPCYTSDSIIISLGKGTVLFVNAQDYATYFIHTTITR